MGKIQILRCLSLVIVGCLTTSVMVKGSETEKEIIISENVREDIKAEEEEVEVLKSKATEYLSQNNFSEAKSIYDKAILMDKGNKDLYLEIKDEYLNIGRLDDAYYIVKTAIDNKIDVENMQLIANDIKNSFDKIEYSHSIVQGDNYELPSEGVINVNNENITVPIDWKETIVNTDGAGNYVYEGTNEQYGRSFIVNLDVKHKPLTESEIREMTLKAKKAIDDVMWCQNLDLDTIIESGDEETGYRSLALSYKYKSRQQIFEALSPYCIDEAINKHLDEYTIEKDGQLYIVVGQAGLVSGIDVMTDNIQIEQTQETLNVTYTNISYAEEIGMQKYSFIKQGNSWRLIEVYLYC